MEKAFADSDALLQSLLEKQAVDRNSTPVRRMGDLTQKWVRLSCSESELPAFKLTARQREIADLIAQTGSVCVKELQYFTGVSVSVIDTLVKKGIAECYEKEIFRTSYRFRQVKERTPIDLTSEQNNAFEGLLETYRKGEQRTALLYGVTGSGKTSVLLKMIDAVVGSGRGVLFMVPEIALTPQMIGIFSNRYGNAIAVFHSAMSLGTRMDEYKRVKNGEAKIAIGTRSAVFAPFKDLGLIIMDEEQEHTYKSEKSPRFHAREIAKFRAAFHKGLLCLASATPSLESFSAAQSGKYALFRLDHRYGNAVLPQVTTVDMKKELLSGNTGSISRELYESIDETLQNGKQAIILLNRRGHNTYITCPSCGYVASCPNCSVSPTYHSANHRLMCHYCGYSEDESKTCPECGNENIRFLGVGTQRVEEELQTLFPSARILRMDADSTMTRDAYTKFLTAFSNGEYDIMLGTQMVAKGLDFPNVTLVGVLGADQALFSEDYRSFERSFSLLTQVVGRAGRGGSSGRAIIQSIDPNSSVISLACMQDYDAFYKEEILTRKVMTFPPYCEVCVICVQSVTRTLADDTIHEVFDRLRTAIGGEYSDVKLIVLGPSVAAMPKVNNRYRYRLTIKCKNNRRFRDLLRYATDVKLKQDVGITVDMNPETVI
ncbi:MAG: primosomal protein N' [Clostridia bacterium]|nr:primosomal protein N' [Clostridia bacterium]